MDIWLIVVHIRNSGVRVKSELIYIWPLHSCFFFFSFFLFIWLVSFILGSFKNKFLIAKMNNARNLPSSRLFHTIFLVFFMPFFFPGLASWSREEASTGVESLPCSMSVPQSLWSSHPLGNLLSALRSLSPWLMKKIRLKCLVETEIRRVPELFWGLSLNHQGNG